MRGFAAAEGEITARKENLVIVPNVRPLRDPKLKGSLAAADVPC